MKNEKEIIQLEKKIRLILASHDDPTKRALVMEMASDVCGDMLAESEFTSEALFKLRWMLRATNLPGCDEASGSVARHRKRLIQMQAGLRVLRHDLNRPDFLARNDARLAEIASELED